MINIFLIPSWYPDKNNTLSGSFIKEQAMMIAEEHENKVNYFVSIASLYTLSPKAIIQSIKNLKNYKNDECKINKLLSNYIEYYSKSLSWSNIVLNGNLDNQIQNHRKRLKNLLNEGIKIDILHAHVSYPAGYIAYILSKDFDIPFIITEHMSPFPFNAYIKNKQILNQIKQSMENSARVIAVSNSLKKDIAKLNMKKEIVVISNFINENNYVEEKAKINKKIFTFLSVGSMTSQKGIDILLRAIKDIPNLQEIKFRIVGDGNQKEEYIKLSQDYNIFDKVEFVGKLDRKNIIEEFNNCDAFVLPSRHESFGIVYIEALAFGKPIIATKCGGPEDIVNDINGKLVDIGDVKQLVEAMLDIIGNINFYDPDAIREDFLNRFSKKLNTKKYVDLYRQVLEENV
ncbi:glycosyltransferase [Pseudofrancisella aestuarii]|uniref:Glycosyltransferase n=1 Tax=Pseudofrancisella aestuarii TaxID=2670347 RepID=A0ABV9TAT7_9GAMM|nr:glycosyltransferase [Pseudofrancisella aestuarii]